MSQEHLYLYAKKKKKKLSQLDREKELLPRDLHFREVLGEAEISS